MMNEFRDAQFAHNAACAGPAQQPQPGLSTLLGQQESMLAGLSKELADLEDMLDHVRFHAVATPGNACTKGIEEMATSTMGQAIQRNNAIIQAISGRLDYLKVTLRGML